MVILFHPEVHDYGGPQVPPTLMQVQKHLCIFRNINASSEILIQVQKTFMKVRLKTLMQVQKTLMQVQKH